MNGLNGDDVLYGESGNDILEGGKGNDTLNGGQDFDTYLYHTNDGNDTINDEDGLGKLLVDNHTLVASRTQNDPANTYKTTHGDLLTLSGNTLTITLHNNGGSINISNFNRSTANLGIELKDESVSYNNSEINSLFFETVAKLAQAAISFVISDSYATTNELAFNPVNPHPDLPYTTLNGTNDNDLMIGRSDDSYDQLIGDAGNDTLYADGTVDDLTNYLNTDSGQTQTLTATPQNELSGQSGEDLLVGGVTSDLLFGGADADILIGGEGADQLVGDESGNAGTGDHPTDGNDQLYAGAGDDTLFGGGGNDFMFGGSGADNMNGSSGADDMFGGDGNDGMAGESIYDTAVGGSYHDYLNGGTGNDSLFGMNGNDELYGGLGDDLLAGDDGTMAVELQGDDQLYGEDGNDTLVGQGYADILVGGIGNDQLYGDSDSTPVAIQGDDYLDGGTGNDSLRGYAGNDLLMGGSGQDTLSGNVGNDNLFGEEDDDLMSGGEDNDTLYGDSGHDELQGGAGDDQLDGGKDNDLLFGEDGADYLLGADGNDQLQGNAGDDTLEGGLGDDRLFGQEDNDQLNDGAGNNTLRGGIGNDVLSSGGGNDKLYGDEDADELYAGDGSDTLFGGTGSDILFGDEGSDYLQGNENNDQLTGGFGDDFLYGQDGDDLLTDYDDNNLLAGGDGFDTLISGDGNDDLYGNAGSDDLSGGDGWDFLSGGSGLDTLRGGAGGDTYYVDLGDGIDRIIDFYEASVDGLSLDNVVVFGQGIYASGITLGLGSLLLNLNDNGDALHLEGFNPDDPYSNPVISRFEFADGTVLSYAELLSRGFDLTGTPDADVLQGTGADDRLDALASDDLVYGNNGDDTLNGGAGVDTLLGGLGNDVYYVDSHEDILIEMIDKGHDSVQSAVDYSLTDHVEDLSLSEVTAVLGTGNSLDNQLTGNAADNQLFGLDGNDTLIGYLGFDSLDGGSGSDFLKGGVGNDFYVVDDPNDLVSENADEGQDRVDSTVSFSLAVNVEDLSLLGDNALDGTGNQADNILNGNVADNRLYGHGGNDTLTGDAGNDLLDGGYGIDFLFGGGGDDHYYVDDSVDQVLEAADDGIDTVSSTVSFVLGAHLENLELLEGQYASGNELANQIIGNAQSNGLDGQGGFDTLIGGAGDDSYAVDQADVIVIEFPDEGYDIVTTSVDYTLADQVESLQLTGTATLTGTGNTLDNSLFGNPGDNLLIGLTGNDQIDGAEGNDQLVGDEGLDSLQGGIGNDTLLGGAENDYLDGGSDLDVMDGGLGDDVYQVDESLDVCVDQDGFDKVYASVDYGLDSSIEALTLTGWQPINGIGNEFDNTLTGNVANNQLLGLAGNDQLLGDWGDDSLFGGIGQDLLDGGDGMDIMQGGEDDDTYRVDTPYDAVIEINAEGQDTVQATTSYTLPDEVENLQLIGDFSQQPWVPPLDGAGNNLDNNIQGNDGDNILGGLEGQDRLDGRAGNDWMSGDAGDDQLYGGDDAIYIAPEGAGGEGSEGYFYNELANNADALNGQEGNDSLDGGSGDDQLYGGEGDDSLFGGQDGQHIFIAALESEVFLSNNDLVDGSLGNDLIDGGSGNDALYGGEGDDNLYGGDDGALNSTNNDFLDGGTGIDSLRGGTGDDLYLVDGSTELLIVSPFDECHIGSGDDDPGPSLTSTADLVIEQPNEGYDIILSSVSLTLPDHVEEVDFIGDGNIDVIGNADFNIILGNVGNNRLDGGLGDDTLIGSLGDDVYFVDSVGDSVIEQFFEGVDTVRSLIDSYSLAENLENLDLVGAALTGYGNELDNLIRGNAQDNLIDSGDGSDLITGAAGNDTLVGGSGNDTYVFSVGFDQDIAIDSDGYYDQVLMNDELTINDITLTRQGNDVLLGLKTTQDQLILSNWFDLPQRIEAIRFCDGTVIDSATIQQAVNNQAPLATDDDIVVQEDLNLMTVANVLVNDSDPDSADSLTVANPGTYQGSYGTWQLSGHGDVSYLVNNTLTAIQALGEGQSLNENLAYRVQDNNPIMPLSSVAAINVTIKGNNDAPILVQPALDQSARVGEPLLFNVANNRFADIDQGDQLTLAAQLANGDALPSWLSFDPLSGSFFGTPNQVGDLPINVSATDTGGLSAYDQLILSVADPNTAGLGDSVWLDSNANGLQESGEAGLVGVTVKLLGANGTVQSTTSTDSQGHYQFSQLAAGAYSIQVIAPTQYQFTLSNQGINDAIDSDVDPISGKTATINLAIGENNLSYDAGLTAIPTSTSCINFNFKGHSATDGCDGNIRQFSVDNVSVNTSAFSRDKMTGDWSKAWLGNYSDGLGVTDSSEGSGKNNAYNVDNAGRDNYVLFEFSKSVVIDKAYLSSVLKDSDIKVWVGTFDNPHLRLNDSVLSRFSFTELNKTTLNSARWADINAQDLSGNTLIIAADTTAKSSDDSFKIQQLTVCLPSSGAQKTCDSDSADDKSTEDSKKITKSDTEHERDSYNIASSDDSDHSNGLCLVGVHDYQQEYYC